MEWQYSLYVICAPLTAMLALGTLLCARRSHHTSPRETIALQWLIVSLLGWVSLNTLELVAPGEAATLFWARATYLFICSTPVAWLGFALHRTGYSQWLAPARFTWFCVVPAIITLLALTNGWHGLIWRAYEFLPAGRFLTMRVVAYGPAFTVCAAYGYTLVAAGTLLIVRRSFASFHLYRQQSRLMAGGAMIPVVFNVVYVFDLIPGLHKDFTPVSFALASIAFAIGMLRYRLFEAKPIARNVVVDTLDDAVLALDAGGRLVDLNRAAMKLIGPVAGVESAYHLLGRPIERVLAAWPELANRLPAGCELRVPLTFDAGNGRRDYDCRALPLADPRGRPAGEVVVLHDVTAHKQAEAELRLYAEALEAQNRELDAFASTVAHDLKNPLTVIQAYTEMLADDSEEMSDQDMHTFLRSISDSTDWMNHIVDELLLLARVRQTNQVPLCSLDMGEVVAQSVCQLDRMIRRSKARVTVADRWPSVVGHPPWLVEVWTNYLSNALKYGGRPDLDLAPQVEIGFDPHPVSGYVRFWVRDHGPGISKEEQGKLFVEFSRLAAHARTTNGHGLGLSIVQRIVEKLGGQVGADSRPGDGSTFWFTLPHDGVTPPCPDLSETPPLHRETAADTLHAARGRTRE